MNFRTLTCATALAIAASLAMGVARAQQTTADPALVAKARAIHERVITMDTHDDINPRYFTAGCNYTMNVPTQVNLPKMIAGGLDASFFIVYVGQGELTAEGYDNAYRQATEKFDAIHRLTKEIAPDKIGLALTSADVRRLDKEGKKIALIGVENGYSLGDETTAIKRVQEFHARGARYLSLAHNGHSQLADSNNGEASRKWLHNGLSPLGKQVIAELNRVGIMIDISHPSKEANMQAMALSKAPVIASHSAARALWNHSRNLDDEQLQALKKNGGVVQTVAFANYVKENAPSRQRVNALAALRTEFGLPDGANLGGGRGGGRGRGAAAPALPAGCNSGTTEAAGRGRQGAGRGGQNNPLASLSAERRAELDQRLNQLDQRFPPPARANVKDFVDHIDYIVKTIGIDHVGISSDFDGGGGVDGWSDASETLNVTTELVRRGYTEQQIAQIWSGNLLRVMDQVQKVAADLKK
jgi:membrane dipeptidase